MSRLIPLSVVFGLAMLATASAQQQIPISGSSAGSVYGPNNALFLTEKAHDGLTNEGNQDAHQGTHWISLDGVLKESITFDLDTTDSPDGYAISQIDIVNTSNSGWNDREADVFGLEFYDSVAAEWLSAVDFPTSMDSYWPDTKSVTEFADIGNVTSVRLTVENLEGVGPVGGGEASVGINEFTVFAVPEPSTLLLLSTACGLLLLGLWRRRS